MHIKIGVSYHCYDNSFTDWDILDTVHNRHPNQFILSTECCQAFNILPKNTVMCLRVWENSEQYAKHIMLVCLQILIKFLLIFKLNFFKFIF